MAMKFIDNKKVGDRLRSFREGKNLSARQFAISTDLDPSHYGKVERADLPITEAMLDKIVAKYPELTYDYVIYGIGKNVPHETDRDSLGPKYLEMRWFGKVAPNEENYFPLIPHKARAGYSKNYENVDFIKDNFEMYPMPPGISPRGADWRWFEVGGESMLPVLNDGDYLLCSMVPHADWLDIDEFKIYVIVWKNEISVKRVAIEDDDYVLISENEEEESQRRVNLSDVKEVWKVRRRITAQLPPSKKFKITV